MIRKRGPGIVWAGFCGAASLWAAGTSEYYQTGSPSPMTDLYVSPNGSDNNAGIARAAPFQTLYAAWSRATDFSANGYRINLLAGTYPFDSAQHNYYSGRTATAQHPLIVTAADSTGRVTLVGGLNLAANSYLYVSNVTLVAGGSYATFDNNVLHLEGCSYVLFRNVTMQGPSYRQNPSNYDIQEVVKANQCDHLYLEDCVISGTYQTGVDWFAVQYGHVLNSRISDCGEWAAYFKGGSAYLRLDGNELFNSGLGFQAGEGSMFELMRRPWVTYECMDVKVVNNVLHHINGTGLSVAGGYNVLMAYNTLYAVATNAGPGHPLLQFVHGSRVCYEATTNAAANYTAGGWGLASAGATLSDQIPNKNVWVYNNVFYNPAPAQTLYQHFDCQLAATPDTSTHLPSPSYSDDGVRLRGNLVWNGSSGHALGLDNATWITNAQVLADNTINTVEPQFANAAATNFHPASTGNLFAAAGYAIPNFSWSDAPASPSVPSGNTTNTVAFDRDGATRTNTAPPGAYSLSAAPAGGATASLTPDIRANGQGGSVTLTSGGTLTVTAALTVGGTAPTCDWWLVAETPYGWYCYVGSWLPVSTLGNTFYPVYQGAAATVPTTTVLSAGTVGWSLGRYVFYFGLDTSLNGGVDLAALTYAAVTVDLQ